MVKTTVKAIPGTKYGRWTVLGEIVPITSDHFTKVKCDCGNEKIVRYSNLRNGTSKSCGCLQHDKLVKRNYKHGMAIRDNKLEKLYFVWHDIKDRCLNLNGQAYPRYGGRGITMCNEWVNDYHAFRTWAYANGYKEGVSIDRIDNDKGYSPDNCRWTTRLVQANNTRRNHFVTYNGETHTLAEWEKITGVKQERIRHRLKNGLSLEQAFFNGDLRKLNKERW